MNKIFANFIANGEDRSEDMQRLAYASWLLDNIPITEFEPDEQIFYRFLDYCCKLEVAVLFKYFQTWLNTELHELLVAEGIKVAGCEALNYSDPLGIETAIQTTKLVMEDNFKVLSAEETDIGDFKVAMTAYFGEKLESRITQVMSETYEQLGETGDRQLATQYLLDMTNYVQDIYSEEVLDELAEDITDDEHPMDLVSTCGLPAIDKDSDGLYTTQLFGVEAQPGTGKTRFAIGTYCYNAIVKYKKNVLFCALEQSKAEVQAMFIARHVFEMTGEQIADKLILKNAVPDNMRASVAAAKTDLFENPNYGKLYIYDKDLYVEEMDKKFKTLDKLKGPFDLIVIDYMGLLESKPQKFKRELQEFEVIKLGFRKFKKYVRRTKKSGIAISQFNQAGIAAGKADKEITTDMAQGGITVYRNTDYNIAISMTATMHAQQKRRFQQPKVRSSSGFPTFIVDTRLGFCYFRQSVEKQV